MSSIVRKSMCYFNSYSKRLEYLKCPSIEEYLNTSYLSHGCAISYSRLYSHENWKMFDMMLCIKSLKINVLIVNSGYG